ncbi:unnamed protein product [Caenorhabditis brenneri]
MDGAQRPQHRHEFMPLPPLAINGIELPKADPLVVGRTLGVFPSEHLFLEEFFLRYQELDTPELRHWFHNNLRAHMPHQDPQHPGRGICGICSCNFLGHPVETHAQEQCPIPLAWRPWILATNTRAYCAKCRGKSERHSNCMGAQETCRNCRDKYDLPGQWHQPPSGLCSIPNEDMEQYFQRIRRDHYRRIVRLSEDQPLRMKCPNDAPLSVMPEGYDRFSGNRAFVDVNREFPPEPFYTDGSTYTGLIPQTEPQRRLQVSQWIDQVARAHYQYQYNTPRVADPELMQQIQAFRAEQQRLENERRADQPQRARRFPRGAPVAQPVQEPLVVGPVRRGRNAPVEMSPKQTLDATFKRLQLFETKEEQEKKLGPVARAMHPEDFRDRIYDENTRKVGSLAYISQDVIDTLRTFAREAAALPDPTPGQRRTTQYGFIPNRDTLRDYAKEAPFKEDMIEVIKDLRYVLLGADEAVQEVETDGFWIDQRTGMDLSTNYADILLKVIFILITGKPNVRMVSTNTIANMMNFSRDTTGEGNIIAIPSPRCFMQEPQHHLAKYFYMCWIVKMARDLI